jgi:hypothetical protein
MISVLGREFLIVAATVVNQHIWISILLRGKHLNLRGKTTGRSHPNLLPLLSNGIQQALL